MLSKDQNIMIPLNKAIHRRQIITQATAAATACVLPSFAYAANQAIGITLPLTGIQAEIAAEMQAGYQLALASQNSTLKLMVLDDSSDAKRAAENTRALASSKQVIALSGIVGTPHAQASLPIAVDAGLPVIGIRSGAQMLRDANENVFHLRASFENELDKMVKMCVGAGLKRMSILYSNDSFGIGSKEHLTKQLTSAGIETGAVISVERDGSNLDQATAKIAEKTKSDYVPTGIALLLIARPMASAATSLRNKHGILVPLLAMSFVANRQIASVQNSTLAGLGLVIAFPLPRSSFLSIASQYRKDAINANKPELIESLTAFEAYFYGSIIARAYTKGMSRQALARSVASGIEFAGTVIQFNEKNVGYSHLEIAYKSKSDGKLRT